MSVNPQPQPVDPPADRARVTTGQAKTMRCRSLIRAASNSRGSPSSAARPDLRGCRLGCALLGAGLAVLAISPNQVRHLRSRYGSAEIKDPDAAATLDECEGRAWGKDGPMGSRRPDAVTGMAVDRRVRHTPAGDPWLV